MSLTKTVWSVTPETFDSLLFLFDPDRELAGRVYETIRRKLLEFFEARGSHSPDEHADEVFDRVMRRIEKGERIEDPGRYCYGVARFVWIEASRNRCRQPVELDERVKLPAADGKSDCEETRERLERQLDCLEKCLNKLAENTREFIIEYYREENGLKIEQRRLQAARLNTTLNALRLRASRLRRELGKCTEICIASTDSNKAK